MIAPALPVSLAPPAPFPLVVAQSSDSEFVAPGVRRGTYRVQSADGPLVIHVVAVDLREPSVRIGAVVASDRMISRGETLSSMAHRTGAIAGANADYFDIGNTFQPLNIVVRDGALQRTPSRRVVFDVRTDRSVHFENVAFAGSVRYGTTTVPLTAVNEWPPQGGASLLSAAYGVVRAAPGVQLAEIVPVDPVRGVAPIAGAYRIASLGPSQTHAVVGNEIGFGPAARALGALPSVGDALAIDVSTAPPLDEIACAVGGGPLLVASGASVEDPNAPAPEERDRRFPVSGALVRTDGTLLLVEVDGRAPAASIGVTRPQFAALALGLGAVSAMAFDSGGSAELIARTLGESAASVFGVPSDGEERSVADGLFIYSDAPVGPPAALVVRPAALVAVPHAAVAIRASIVDAVGHALGEARLDGGNVIRVGTVAGVATVRADGLHADVPVDVVASLARLELTSDARNPSPNARVQLRANGYDARGRVVALGDAVTFEADRGSVGRDGAYRTGERDATVVARAAGARASLVVRVGRHVEPLAYFDGAHAGAWHFASAPAGALRTLTFTNEPPQLRLPVDFSRDERAAYAYASGLTLPGEPLAFSVDIASDVRGVGVRASFVNRLGEARALTLTKSVDWDGFATRTIALPADLNPPVKLVALYAVNTLGTPVRAAGALAFRKPSVLVAGTP
ncbi:MAG: hypothetical protein NVS3B16_00220 [Vulcanimicrobiaceae bacterium]